MALRDNINRNKSIGFGICNEFRGPLERIKDILKITSITRAYSRLLLKIFIKFENMEKELLKLQYLYL